VGGAHAPSSAASSPPRGNHRTGHHDAQRAKSLDALLQLARCGAVWQPEPRGPVSVRPTQYHTDDETKCAPETTALGPLCGCHWAPALNTGGRNPKAISEPWGRLASEADISGLTACISG
jgi:hypothetical protein